MAVNSYQLLATREYAKSYRDLSGSDISLLAIILSHQPAPSVPRSSYQWESYQLAIKSDIEKLPDRLRSHPSIWRRCINEHIADLLRVDLGEQKLCPMHHKLNRYVLRSMLRWVKDEISVNIPNMLLPLVQDKLLTSEVREMFIRLRKVSGMWHTKDEYQNLYGQSVESRWTEQEDRCSACILSRLGGDADVLVALRAGLLARSRSVKIKNSRRMAYIEALIREGFDEEMSIKMLGDSTWIGAEIKVIRKQHHGRRKEKRDELEVSPQQTQVPVVDEAFLADQDLALQERQVAASSPIIVGTSTTNKPGSEGGSVYSEHGVDDGDDIYDEIEELIKEYEGMRNTIINAGSRRQRDYVATPKPLPQYRRANSRAISYMQGLRANAFRSGIQSLEGDAASTTWSQFAGP